MTFEIIQFHYHICFPLDAATPLQHCATLLSYFALTSLHSCDGIIRRRCKKDLRRSKCGKIRTRKTANTDTFQAVFMTFLNTFIAEGFEKQDFVCIEITKSFEVNHLKSA